MQIEIGNHKQFYSICTGDKAGREWSWHPSTT